MLSQTASHPLRMELLHVTLHKGTTQDIPRHSDTCVEVTVSYILSKLKETTQTALLHLHITHPVVHDMSFLSITSRPTNQLT